MDLAQTTLFVTSVVFFLLGFVCELLATNCIFSEMRLNAGSEWHEKGRGCWIIAALLFTVFSLRLFMDCM